MGILNSTMSPIFFKIFHLPFLCDLVGFACITLAVWWVRKFGTATMTGVIATIINLMIRPEGTHFFGFTAASVVFDVLASLIEYKRLFEKGMLGSLSLFTISVLSAAVAGLIIGSFFMPPVALQMRGGILGWAGLHAVGGVIGGAMGVFLMNALTARGILAKGVENKQRIRSKNHDVVGSR